MNTLVREFPAARATTVPEPSELDPSISTAYGTKLSGLSSSTDTDTVAAASKVNV